MKARHENYTIISKEAWEQTRLQCFYSASAFGGKIRKPSDLFKFPWETETKAKTITKQMALERLTGRNNGK